MTRYKCPDPDCPPTSTQPADVTVGSDPVPTGVCAECNQEHPLAGFTTLAD